ncbi:MAG: DNA primase [bacterium]|nr:DNA primase [bacterium]
MDQVAQVREKMDLVSLISEYLPLKRAGRNFKANCPFHGEKTPSFVVSPERQIWHCFGCQKGGDCFTFLMEYEKLEFPEALRMLAKKTGVELKETSSWQSGISSKKEKIYKLNKLAQDYYHFLLTKHNIGKKALQYLVDRKITKASIENFKIGFAPRINSALSTYLTLKKKFKKEDLIEAGLVNQRGNNIVDFFVNRIIFPLIDHRGNIMGFSGRIFQDEQNDLSKYVNTRETLVYHKGEVFFGLNLAKDEIKKEDRAIITEGEFDVISAFQEGVKNIIAVKGSALTESQVNLLARFTKNIVCCFDTDKAGQEALKRSLATLEKKELFTSVLILWDAKDIDEAVKKDPIQFKKAVKNVVNVYDFLFSKTFSLFNLETAEGKRKISDELLPILVGIGNEIIKEHYLKKLAHDLDISFESISKQAEKNKTKTDFIKKEEPKEKRPRTEVLEEYLLALIFQNENTVGILKTIEKDLYNFLPKETASQKILGEIFDFIKGKDSFDYQSFSVNLSLELISSFDKAFLFPIPKLNNTLFSDEINKAALDLKDLYLRSKVKAISEKIKNKDKNLTDEELIKLKEELRISIENLQKSPPEVTME